MPLLNKREYKKKKPYRDASLFLIICEGEKTEYLYFEFFDGLSSQLKVISVPSEKGKSSPNHLITNARKAVEQYVSDGGDYELWFVIDLDKWLKHNHIHNVYKEIKGKHWNIAISNPCFEVWLAAHFSKNSPEEEPHKCSSWKQFVPTLCGAFDPHKHPSLIPVAIENCESNLIEDGYVPEVGSSQIFRLGKKVYELVGKELEKYTSI